MEQIQLSSDSGMQASVILGRGQERDRAERELLEAGVPLPLTHRTFWAANSYRWNPLFVLVRDGYGRARGGLGFEQVQSRTMPGYSIVRVRNFGGGSSEEVRRVALEALLMYARRGARVLRLHVNVFSREEREEIANLLATLGFRELNPPSSYRHTLAVDLKPSEEELFAALSKSARTRVRECVKKGLATVPITDLAYAARLEQLQKEALRRTGGHTASTNWEGVLTMSRDHPSLSRVLGVFTGESLAPENMKAFGWVCNHGETGEYRAAGSSRDGESRLPFGYAVVWEMIRWAKATGAHWFDMGGVTVSGGNDPLEGISDFKRFFSRELVEVGAEWVFEPSPLRARIANGVSGLRVQLQKSFDRCGGEGERVRPVSH